MNDASERIRESVDSPTYFFRPSGYRSTGDGERNEYPVVRVEKMNALTTEPTNRRAPPYIAMGDVIFLDLLSRAKLGEASALGQLWRANNPHLMRFLYSLGVAEPEDVASETWISMARALKGFEGRESNFRVLLFHIARRRVVDSLRARYRRSTVPLHDHGALEQSREQTVMTGDGNIDDALELLRALPGAQAEVIALRVLLELEVSEVAEIVGRSEGAVRVLSHRGLTRLSTLMQERGYRAPEAGRSRAAENAQNLEGGGAVGHTRGSRVAQSTGTTMENGRGTDA